MGPPVAAGPQPTSCFPVLALLGGLSGRPCYPFLTASGLRRCGVRQPYKRCEVHRPRGRDPSLILVAALWFSAGALPVGVVARARAAAGQAPDRAPPTGGWTPASHHNHNRSSGVGIGGQGTAGMVQASVHTHKECDVLWTLGLQRHHVR